MNEFVKNATETAKKIVNKQNAKLAWDVVKRTVVTYSAWTILNKDGFSCSNLDLSCLHPGTAKDKAILSLYKVAKTAWSDSERAKIAKDIAQKAIDSHDDGTRRLAIDLLEKLSSLSWSSTSRSAIAQLISNIGDAE